MSVRAEKLGAFHADRPITERCSFGGAGDNSDVLGHVVRLPRRAPEKKGPASRHTTDHELLDSRHIRRLRFCSHSPIVRRPASVALLPSTVRQGRPTVVPELSRFLGIVIAMYYRDHAPAHFHALYGGFEITVEVTTGLVDGYFPPRALAHVQEWRELRRTELLEAWQLARASKPLRRIDPLE
jgi:hypothetical protein